MKKIYTANRETGDFIEEFWNFETAEKAILTYEEKDKSDGVYGENSYDIVDETHCSLRMVYLECRKNGGMLHGICRGYSKEYLENKYSLGYDEISKAEYDKIMQKDLAINYDYE